MSVRFKRRVVRKTADYTITGLNDPAETVFTNGGADGAVDLTLPPPTVHYLGWRYYAKAVADFAFGFVGASAGDIVTKDDAAADSVKASTGNEIIGAVIEAECIESASGVYQWQVAGIAVGHTYTVA